MSLTSYLAAPSRVWMDAHSRGAGSLMNFIGSGKPFFIINPKWI